MKTFLLVTLGMCLVGCSTQPEEDHHAATVRMLAIETAEIECQTKLVGIMREHYAREYCRQQLHPQWDQWTHEFPDAARERALARQL